MKNFVRFTRELKPYRGVLALIAALTFTSAGLALPLPTIIGNLIDLLFKHAKVNLLVYFGLILGISAASGVVGYALSISVTYLGQRFMLDIRRKLYAHLQTLSLGFFEKSQTGKLMSNIINDVATINQLLTGGFVTMISDITTLCAVIFLVFFKNWRLAMVGILPIYPLYIANYLLAIGRIKTTSREIRDQRDVMLGDLQEKLAGAMVVKSYAKERFEVKQFVGETRSLLDLNVRIGRFGTGLWTRAEFIGAIGTALILWYGGREVLQGTMTPGALLAFLSYAMGYFFAPTVRLIQMNEILARTNAALERIFYTLDVKPNIVDQPNASDLPVLKGDVEYRDVWFEYEPDQPVIKGVNLHVKPGQLVAFVGQSGSGKTTMINLLSRHYDVTHGAILVDGIDIRSVNLYSLRQQVGVVIQETILFNATIRENIRYGRLDATDEEIEAAARAANIAHVIEALPKGYDTRIGEEGVKLSGGEKQRIAIARAILSDPRILILDEATSALDSETEALIQEALERLMKGRTSFVIAHRLSTIVKADLIVVMEKGVIREQGSHLELLAINGIYAGLYNQQFKVALDAAEAARASASVSETAGS